MEKNKPAVYKKKYSFNNFYSRFENLENQEDRIVNILQSAINDSKYIQYQNVLKSALEDLLSEPSEGNDKFVVTPYIASEVLFLADDLVPRYIYHRYRYDVYPIKRIIDDYPPYMQIEPSSICNYRCIFCYQTDTSFSNAKSGFMGAMDVELFKQIIDKIENKVDFISLASRGEPLACKGVDKMLEYTVGKFLGLKINTNASLLTEKMAHAILSSGISTVVYSADAADDEMYSKFRVNGVLSKVVANIEQFNKIRATQYPDSKIITRVSGVKVSEEQDMEKMTSFWKDNVDQVAFVKYNPWENVYESPVNDIVEPCSDLWRRMFVWYDGLCNPCDTDYKSTLQVGDVKEKSVTEIWRSAKYEGLRKSHNSQKRGMVEPCKKCKVT